MDSVCVKQAPLSTHLGDAMLHEHTVTPATPEEHKRLADDAVWETVSRPPRAGKQACLDYLDTLHRTTGMEYSGIITHDEIGGVLAALTQRPATADSPADLR
jgi:hypothetical protein